MKRIESRNNPTIKLMCALSDRKERERQRLFYFEGVHLLEEYLRSGNKPKYIFAREDAVSKYSELLATAGCEIFEVTGSVYEKLSDEKAPQGIFTVSEFLDNIFSLDENSVLNINGNSIMLVDLQDTGNVGTVIRTAAAMDSDVLLCGSCADIYSSKTVRATMGALFTGRMFISKNTSAAIEILQNNGHRVIATALTDKAEVLGGFSVDKTDCFVVGNEGKGLSSEVIDKCNFTCIVPMSGKTESLNAAIASAMLLWESRRGEMF